VTDKLEAAVWTVQRMLAWMTQDLNAHGVASPRLDAELLLGHALGYERVRLYLDMQRPLAADELARVRGLVVRRRKREPVAYILGEREFYRRRFAITRDVLVPRPETELLVDRALELTAAEATRALDLCTGSGAIAITLALEREGLQVDATEISEAALVVARGNAERLGAAERVRFHQGDLFAGLVPARDYDLIAANPPYVREAEYAALEPEITQHEPKQAFVAGGDGLAVIARICTEAADHLRPGGALLIEVGSGQAAQVIHLLERDGRFAELAAHRDLSGIDRVVAARRS
jgi:release factor glutamine methyltransferase